MGQEVSQLRQECDCWVSSDLDRDQAVQVQTMVDPVANLLAKDFPVHRTAVSPPAASA
ncbi:unnamed protein product, partial [Effrenium voratum]